MKILMVTPTYHPIVGGTETFVQDISVALNRKGIDTDVMTFHMDVAWNPKGKGETKEEDGFKIFRIQAFNPFGSRTWGPYRMLFNIHVIPKLSFAKRVREYDIIHFHDDSDLSFPLFARFIKRPKILHCHSLCYTYKKYKNNFLCRKLLKKAADLYLGSSSCIEKLLLDLGLPKDRLATLRYAVDTEIFRPDENKKLDNTILFVARIARNKGLEVLLKALPYLEIQTELVIIGPISEPEYFEEIQDLIRKIDAENVHKVTYLGLVDKSTLIEWYQKASIFVCPSLSEVTGITNIEALACGTVDIATNVGGIPDVVKDGVNGILIPPNDPRTLASALEKLLEDKEMRESFGKAGRRMVKQYFSYGVIKEELIEIYENLIQKSFL